MPTHRFTIGQSVRLINTKALARQAACTYTIQAPMPPQDNIPQYRLYNEELNQERVALEREIEVILLT